VAAPLQLTRTHRILIGVVVFGAVIIAGIGFAGSYSAVRELALKKGFGHFSYVFPIGIDAGICVLLALDLLLTWIRIPFPLLRQTAWLLTAATIAFNGAAAWPDPLGVGMHAVIPLLFVVSVEAARHAIGRIADITADKHMEGVRLTRWILSPVPTFLLWRRMKLWELRSYEQVIRLEQERLVYQARLRSRFGRAWRRKAPVESLMPLRLARYGVPLAETAPAGLAAAGIEPALIPPAPKSSQSQQSLQDQHSPAAAPPAEQRPELVRGKNPDPAHQESGPPANPRPHSRDPQAVEYDPAYDPQAAYTQWGAEQQQAGQHVRQRHPQEQHSPGSPDAPDFPDFPDQYIEEHAQGQLQERFPAPYGPERYEETPQGPEPRSSEDTGSFQIPVSPSRTRELGEGGGTPDPDEEALYQVFKQSISGSGYPTPREFSNNVEATYGHPVLDSDAKRMVLRFQNRHTAELEDDHVA
jgi:hypothetical protein